MRLLILLSGLLALLIFSCGSPKGAKPGNASQRQSQKVMIKSLHSPGFVAPGSKDLSQIDGEIMGKGLASPQMMTRFLLVNNPRLDSEKVQYLAQLYYEEALKEGINHDIAFAQMCLETAYLKFGNQVKAAQNNFCGLGALDGGASGATFESEQIGVRAHIQHLKAYASRQALNEKLVDPRFRFVKRGIAPTVDHLAGRWASDTKYGEKIRSVIFKLHQISTY